ncbi:MAG: L-fuculokinase [Lachnotalea sp.]
MSIGGLDIGTTGCKITVYSDEGKYLDKAYREYPVSRSTSTHEVKAEYIWKAVKEVIKEVSEKNPDIKGIGVTSFGETFVMLDDNNNPIFPSMLYTDPRGNVECEEIENSIGAEKIAYITGLNPHSMFSLPKIMWIKKNQQKEYASVKHIMLMEDYIVFMLTGTAQIDYSLATRTMAFDIRSLSWSKEILEAAGVDINLLSRPVPTGTSAGCVKEILLKELGLTKDAIIVSIGHDQIAAAIGAGVFDSDIAVDGAGTVECITPVFDKLPDNNILFKGGYAVVPYIVPGKYVCYAFTYTGGALVKWFVDNLAGYEKSLADEQKKSVYEVLEQKMEDAPTGILVLPHFAGAATPYMDSGSKGAIVGLTVGHTASDLYRAMMEGVVYEMHLNMEELNKAGIEFKILRATGGGANSKVWMQMKADILNIPISSLGSSEAGTVGCVMLTAIAVGVYKNIKEASDSLVKELDFYYPRKEQHEAYMKYYKRYKELYKAVRPLV